MNISLMNEIAQERAYQIAKWGTLADDEQNTPNDFVSYIGSYSTRWFPGGFTPYSPETVDEFRKSMVKTATLAIAAIESVDRQREEAGHAFYEAGMRPSLEKVVAAND